MTAPLFAANEEEVLKALRLSETCAQGDPRAIFEQALQSVRGHFYRRLGFSRVAALEAMPFVENPTDNDGVLRMIAVNTEITWIRLTLSDMLPVMFMDGGNDTQRVWNEEGSFRSLGAFQLGSFQKRLRLEIEESLHMLADLEQPGNETSVQTFDGTPDTPPAKPFDSIRNF